MVSLKANVCLYLKNKCKYFEVLLPLDPHQKGGIHLRITVLIP